MLKKFTLLLLLLASLFTAYSQADNKSVFIEYLDKGYAQRVKVYDYEPLVFGFLVKRKSTCIYGEAPNKVVKRVIDNLYALITNELNELDSPKYVSTILECPKDTSIFTFIHSSLEQPNDRLRSEFEKAYIYSKTSINIKHKVHWVFNGAGSSHIIRGSNGKMFVEINQLNNLIKQDKIYEKVAKSIALEELYHAISGGKDIHFSKKMMSKLNEPSIKRNIKTVKQKEPLVFSVKNIDSDQYNAYFRNYILDLKPESLCTFDLWFLLLADEIKNKKTVKYKNYVRLFNNKYDQIKKRALQIENNPKYSNLFDTRCSGSNAGVATKITAE